MHVYPVVISKNSTMAFCHCIFSIKRYPKVLSLIGEELDVLMLLKKFVNPCSRQSPQGSYSLE